MPKVRKTMTSQSRIRRMWWLLWGVAILVALADALIANVALPGSYAQDNVTARDSVRRGQPADGAHAIGFRYQVAAEAKRGHESAPR